MKKLGRTSSDIDRKPTKLAAALIKIIDYEGTVGCKEGTGGEKNVESELDVKIFTFQGRDMSGRGGEKSACDMKAQALKVADRVLSAQYSLSFQQQ